MFEEIMKIITLSLNPAFDIHCDIPGFAPYHENLAHITSNDAGGKGINISRALCENGVDNLAFVLLGDENGTVFEQALVRDGINFRKLTVKGRIRENITCHTPGMPETRISFEGFRVEEEQMELVYQQLADDIDPDTIVTFSGRAPAGVDVGSVKGLLGRFARQGARLVIDSRSFSLADLREMRPWLIKPNQEEISGYLEREINDFEQVAGAAEQLRRDGIDNVMVSMGSKGALLACDEGLFIAAAPAVEVRSTVGAGDSTIAGFLSAASKRACAQERLRTAVAYGSAACTTQGTRPPRSADITRLLPDVQITRLK